MNKRTIQILLMISLVLLVIAARYGIKAYVNKTGNGAEVAVIKQEGAVNIGGPFTLVDHTGKTVTEQDFKDVYTLVYFGYTFCPDACPTGLANIQRALDMLPPDKVKFFKVLFISIDPERDTPEKLAAYVKSFHPNTIGLTGTPEQVEAAKKAYKAYGRKVEDQAASDYTMSHSTYVYLMMLGDKYITHFVHDTPTEEMAKTLKTVL